MSKELREFQLEVLKMIKDVDALFNSENIEYFLLHGSVLGAVRHKGFIPWDDDLDIGIKRKYFSYAERMLETKLGENYIYEAAEKHSIPGAPIGHLYLKVDSNKNLAEVPTIDVFALDGAPKNACLQIMQVLLGHVYNLCVFGCPAKNQGILGNALTKLFLIIFRNKSRQFIKRLAYKFITRWDSETSPYITNLYGYSNRKELTPIDYFISPSYLLFEDIILPVPNQPHKYLTKIYGNYMELPPVEKRQPHHKDILYIQP